MEKKYDSKLYRLPDTQDLNRKINTMRKSAVSLSDSKIPLESQNHLKKVLLSQVKENLQMLTEKMPNEIIEIVNQSDEANDQLIEFLKTMQPNKLSNKEKLNPHGKEVVEKVIAEGKCEEFIKIFRRHFLDTCQP